MAREFGIERLSCAFLLLLQEFVCCLLKKRQFREFEGLHKVSPVLPSVERTNENNGEAFVKTNSLRVNNMPFLFGNGASREKHFGNKRTFFRLPSCAFYSIPHTSGKRLCRKLNKMVPLSVICFFVTLENFLIFNFSRKFLKETYSKAFEKF